MAGDFGVAGVQGSHFLTALILEHSSPGGTRKEACVCKTGLHLTISRSQPHLTVSNVDTSVGVILHHLAKSNLIFK